MGSAGSVRGSVRAQNREGNAVDDFSFLNKVETRNILVKDSSVSVLK